MVRGNPVSQRCERGYAGSHLYCENLGSPKHRPGLHPFLIEASVLTDDRRTTQMTTQVAAARGFLPSVPQGGRHG